MAKIVFFPHSKEKEGFENEYVLRDWLDVGLRIHKRGVYFLREARGLGDLEEGSLVFFHINSQIVGSAVVDRAKRETTEAEKEREGDYYKYVVGFSPSSIWAFGDYEFVDIDEAEKIVGKTIRQGFTMVDDITKLMDIYKRAVSNLVSW